jgi:hypothetical protein
VTPAVPAEPQIARFVAKFTPAIAAELRAARARLCARFPRGFELVYDNYNALVFAVSPTEKTSDAFISVAGYPNWVTLFFLPGTDLHDPHGLLEGAGKQVRSIRLRNPAQIDTPAVRALIAQAARPHAPAFRRAPALTTIVKAVVAKQRPRRPAAKPKPVPAGAAAKPKRPAARR